MIADRVMGLLTMLLLASAGILGAGLLNTDSAESQILYEMLLLFSAIVWGVSILLLLVGSLTGPWVRESRSRFRSRAKQFPGCSARCRFTEAKR